MQVKISNLPRFNPFLSKYLHFFRCQHSDMVIFKILVLQVHAGSTCISCRFLLQEYALLFSFSVEMMPFDTETEYRFDKYNKSPRIPGAFAPCSALFFGSFPFLRSFLTQNRNANQRKGKKQAHVCILHKTKASGSRFQTKRKPDFVNQPAFSTTILPSTTVAIAVSPAFRTPSSIRSAAASSIEL